MSARPAAAGDARGLIVAAPASGSGKTTLVAGLLRLLVRRGVGITGIKLGPDYIDPAFHAAASGQACLNIDLWAMRPESVAGLLAGIASRGATVIAEAAMGLFDGATDGSGSGADFAALTGWPVVLVVDARGQAQSAGALLAGFARYRADVPIAGVVFNRVGALSHEATLRAVARPLGIPVLGCLPRAANLILPERHLGLVQAAEHGDLEAFLERLATCVDQHLDVESLLRLSRPLRSAFGAAGAFLPPLGQRIAVARDEAFGFAYPAQLAAWREAGADIDLFSPLADEAPPGSCDAIFLPGGYPELHAGRLAAANRFLEGLRLAEARGAAIFGECGGYMTLGAGLIDAQGRRHAMAGLLPLVSSFAQPRLHLGYRQAALLGNGALGPAGSRFRGHEFHYAETIDEGPGEALFEITDARGTALGRAGRRRGKVAGSFIHLIDRCAVAN